MKALVVDDDPGVLKVLGKSVERLGYSCLLAPGAGEALEAFSRGPFELIVTDLLMPGMHGFEFILRARRAMPEAAIVVVTALDGIKTSLEALKRGADEHVVKPFGVRQMDCAVARARGRRQRLAAMERDAHRLVERRRRLHAVESAMVQLVERTVHDQSRRGSGSQPAAAPTVPILVKGAVSAAAVAGEGMRRYGGVAKRVEGYLERDEQRELGHGTR